MDLSRFKNGRRIKDLKSALLSIKPYKCECCGNSE
nr:MAG TPA: C2H2 type zinc-finger protein [Caudoviricetes sp.]